MYFNILRMYIGQTFNCSDVANMLKENFDVLSNLSYSNMSGCLFSYEVVTQQEKLEIDQLVGKLQMEKVLHIVIASLKANKTTKYKGFLVAMKNSEDALLNVIAKDLGEWILSELPIIDMCILAHVYIDL